METGRQGEAKQIREQIGGTKSKRKACFPQGVHCRNAFQSPCCICFPPQSHCRDVGLPVPVEPAPALTARQEGILGGLTCYKLLFPQPTFGPSSPFTWVPGPTIGHGFFCLCVFVCLIEVQLIYNVVLISTAGHVFGHKKEDPLSRSHGGWEWEHLRF